MGDEAIEGVVHFELPTPDDEFSTIQRKHAQLLSLAPPRLRREPNEEELAERRAYKQATRRFFSSLEPEQCMRLEESIRESKKQRELEAKQAAMKRHAKQQTPKRKGPNITVRPNKLLSLWNKNEAFQFSQVIPFCSHVNRSAFEREQDETLGIDRCVFSNLFVDSAPMILPKTDDPVISELLGRATRFQGGEGGLCSESFYMAAKCEHLCDAIFVMEDLTRSMDVARFGHHALKLDSSQRKRLIELGADPEDFLLVTDGDNGEQSWLRGADGQLPTRESWRRTRHFIFLYLLRIKFGTAIEGSTVHSTTKTLVERINKDEIPFLIEHRRLDPFWGDAEDGSGFNVLGKSLTQVLLEVAGKADPVPLLYENETTDCNEILFQANCVHVNYEMDESPRR